MAHFVNLPILGGTNRYFWSLRTSCKLLYLSSVSIVVDWAILAPSEKNQNNKCYKKTEQKYVSAISMFSHKY